MDLPPLRSGVVIPRIALRHHQDDCARARDERYCACRGCKSCGHSPDNHGGEGAPCGGLGPNGTLCRCRSFR